jgi:hypothetical protein
MSDERADLMLRVARFALEVQGRVDAIFRADPDVVEVIPWVGSDGELLLIQVTSVDAGL